MSSILKVDNLQTGAGATHSISSLGITSPGTVLQEIHGACDGRTVSGITFAAGLPMSKVGIWIELGRKYSLPESKGVEIIFCNIVIR